MHVLTGLTGLTVLLVVVVGLVVGLAVGALGGGGSIIAVPVLVYLFHQDAAAATTGSLVVVAVTAALGGLAHRRSGRVRLRQGMLFGLLTVGGSYVGSRLSVSVPDAVLLSLFAVLLLVVAALMTRRRRAAAAAARADQAPVPDAVPDPVPDAVPPPPELTPGPRSWDARRVAVLVVVATVVGLGTGFFGVGGGFAVVPALVLVLGLEMPTAVGTSLVVMTITSLAGLASRAAHPVQLDVPLIAGFAAAAVVGSLVGERLVGRVSPARLSLAFTVLLVVAAIYTAVRSVPQLW